MNSSAMPEPAILISRAPVLHPRHLRPRGLGHGFWGGDFTFCESGVRLDGRVGGAGAAGTTFRDGDGERGKEDGLVVGRIA